MGGAPSDSASSPPTAPPSLTTELPPATSPPRRKGGAGKWIIIGIAAVVIIAGITAAIIFAVPNVTITGLNLDVRGPNAGLCTSTLSVPVGPHVYLYSSRNYALATTLSNSGTPGSSCTVTSVATNSTGWTSSPITGTIVVCGQGSPATFALSFKTPSGAYYGPLTIEANATYAATSASCPT